MAVLSVLIGGGLVYFQKYTMVTPNQFSSSNLENKLLGTAWIQLDPNGEETDFEIDFRKTKENDSHHLLYDYEDYLHHRPGESGYWKTENDTVTIIGTPSTVPPIVYTNVKIIGTILSMTDSGVVITFKRITRIPQ
jgi:hypothetical protein